MAQNPAAKWLYDHWSPEYLPNNEWTAVTAGGTVIHDKSLDIVIDAVISQGLLEEVTYAFVTFDLWQ